MCHTFPPKFDVQTSSNSCCDYQISSGSPSHDSAINRGTLLFKQNKMSYVSQHKCAKKISKIQGWSTISNTLVGRVLVLKLTDLSNLTILATKVDKNRPNVNSFKKFYVSWHKREWKGWEKKCSRAAFFVAAYADFFRLVLSHKKTTLFEEPKSRF